MYLCPKPSGHRKICGHIGFGKHVQLARLAGFVTGGLFVISGV
jgi:hypothetical protein